MQDYVVSELDSGERIVSETVSSVRSVALGFWIGAGSRDESDPKAGISHFIEHLLFKGSRSYTSQEIAEISDVLGGELNAATSRETTTLYARVPDDRLETAVELTADMVFAPLFDDLDAEREVVLEEIAMVEDTPQELVHDLIGEAIFGAHPLGRPVIGRAEVVSSVERRTLAAYHRAAYAPDNVVVAAAGNVDHETLVTMLERAIEARRPTPSVRRPRRARAAGDIAPGIRFARKDTEQYHVCLGAPGVSRSDPRRFAASLLDAILGGSASSRLFQEIREKRGLAYSVYSFLSQYSDTGMVGIYVGTREENLETCVEIAMREIADVAGGTLRPDELERAKDNLKGRLMLSMESTSNRMSRLGKSLVTKTELLPFERVIEELDAVDGDAVAELAAELLAPARLSAAGIGPSEERFRAAVEHVSAALAA